MSLVGKIAGYKVNKCKSDAFLSTIANCDKEKFKKEPYLQSHQKNKIPGNKSNQQLCGSH